MHTLTNSTCNWDEVGDTLISQQNQVYDMLIAMHERLTLGPHPATANHGHIHLEPVLQIGIAAKEYGFPHLVQLLRIQAAWRQCRWGDVDYMGLQWMDI